MIYEKEICKLNFGQELVVECNTSDPNNNLFEFKNIRKNELGIYHIKIIINGSFGIIDEVT